MRTKSGLSTIRSAHKTLRVPCSTRLEDVAAIAAREGLVLFSDRRGRAVGRPVRG